MSACGGGGSSAGTTPTGPTPAPGATTYALQAGYKALVQAGSTDNFTVSGDCTGTAQMVNAAATAASFEGISGFSQNVTSTLTLPGCGVSNNASSSRYYDANFAAIGAVAQNMTYSDLDTAAAPFPASVTVGATAPIFSVLGSYNDSTKAVRVGYAVSGYSIDADTQSPTTNTALFHLSSKAYDNANGLQLTQVATYRMKPDGSLTLLTVDLQYAPGVSNNLHLVYTRTP